jgi:hypothetical protein
MKTITTASLILALAIALALWLTKPETLQTPTPTKPTTTPTKSKPTSTTIQYIEDKKPLHVNNETALDSVTIQEIPISNTDKNATSSYAQTQTDNYKISFKIPKIEPNAPSRTIQLDGNVESEAFDRIIPLQIPLEGNITMMVEGIYQDEKNEFNVDISTLNDAESWLVFVDMQNSSIQTKPTPSPKPNQNQESNQKDTILPQLGQNED